MVIIYHDNDFFWAKINIQGGPKKRGHRLMNIILSNLNRCKKNFAERFLGKFVVKWILKVAPHLACVATLPCETLMSPKQAINNKLQGSVAAYLRYGGVVNNQEMFIADSAGEKKL